MMKKINTILWILLLTVTCVNGAAWAAEQAADKLVVGIMPFISDATSKGKVADEAAEMRGLIAREIFLKALANSSGLAVIRQDIIDDLVRNLDPNALEQADVGSVVEIGRRSGAQYMLSGKVAKVDQKNTTRNKGFFFGKTRETTLNANAELNVKVIDVGSGKIVMDLSGYGSAREQHSTNVGIGLPLTGLLGGLSNLAEHVSDMKASTMKNESANQSAVVDAAFNLANKVKSELTGEYISVSNVKNDSVEINADASSGLNEEDLYLVYLDGAEMRNKDGVLTEREKIPVAVVRVDMIHRGYSVAQSVPSGGNVHLVRKGDKVESISSAMSKELTKGKKFITERPKERQSSGDGSLLGKSVPSSPSSLPSQAPANAAKTSANAGSLPAQQESEKSGKTTTLSSSSAASTRSGRPLENDSTDPAKVIPVYGLPSGEANTRRIAHLNARKLNGQKAYDKYVELATSYDGDYLAAYQAGEAARKLKKKEDAKAWYGKALAINPDYKPAQTALKKIG